MRNRNRRHTEKFRCQSEMLEARNLLSASGPVAIPAPMESYVIVLADDVVDVARTANELVNTSRGELAHTYSKAIRGFSAKLPAQAVDALSRLPQVKYIERDGIASTAAQQLPRGVDLIDADLNPTAAIGSGGFVDVDVAIFDTGVEPTHPDLNVVGGVRVQPATKGKPRWIYDESPAAYTDLNGHGTHVAGIVGALDNEIGYVGVAPGARIWSIGVLDSNGTGSVSQIIAGIDWVMSRAGTIEVANFSLVTPHSTALNDAVRGMVDVGIFVSVAAGNDATDASLYSPASEPSAFTVSAVADYDGRRGGMIPVALSAGYDDSLANFSNYGAVVDAAAPGTWVWSTSINGGYNLRSGTSSAAPHAAGAAALQIADDGRANDASGVESIANALLATGIPMVDWRVDGTAPAYDPDGIHEPLISVRPNIPNDHLAPDTPLNVTATANVDGSISIAWAENSESDLIGYLVYRGTSASGPFELVRTWPRTPNLGGWDTATTDRTVTSGVEYFYRLTAIDYDYNESAPSLVASAMALDQVAPAVPSGLAATAGDAQITLNWNANTEADLSGYNLYRATTSGGPLQRLNSTPLTDTSFVDVGLTNDTSYYYVVTSADVNGNESAYSSEVFATPTVVAQLSIAGATWTTSIKRNNRWTASATVSIEAGGQPASGVAVTANWGSPLNQNVTRITDGNGQVTFDSGSLSQGTQIVLSILELDNQTLDPPYTIVMQKGESGLASTIAAAVNWVEIAQPHVVQLSDSPVKSKTTVQSATAQSSYQGERLLADDDDLFVELAQGMVSTRHHRDNESDLVDLLGAIVAELEKELLV